MGLGELY